MILQMFYSLLAFFLAQQMLHNYLYVYYWSNH